MTTRSLIYGILGIILIIVVLVLAVNVARGLVGSRTIAIATATPLPVVTVTPSPAPAQPTPTNTPILTLTPKPRYTPKPTPRPTSVPRTYVIQSAASGTPTAVPNPTVAPLVSPEPGRAGRLVGGITTLVPLEFTNLYLATVETSDYKNYNLFIPSGIAVQDENGRTVDRNYVRVGQYIDASIEPTVGGFEATSLNVTAS